MQLRYCVFSKCLNKVGTRCYEITLGYRFGLWKKELSEEVDFNMKPDT